MKLPEALGPTVTALGIDDFSIKRWRRFGTLLVNLKTHRVIDVLPERKIESAATWMRRHPEIQYVSRDRGNDYAQAIREGAPQAMAIADRFHLTKNLVEAIEPIVAQSYKQLRKELSLFPESPALEGNEWRQAVTPGRQRVLHAL